MTKEKRSCFRKAIWHYSLNVYLPEVGCWQILYHGIYFITMDTIRERARRIYETLFPEVEAYYAQVGISTDLGYFANILMGNQTQWLLEEYVRERNIPLPESYEHVIPEGDYPLNPENPAAVRLFVLGLTMSPEEFETEIMANVRNKMDAVLRERGLRD